MELPEMPGVDLPIEEIAKDLSREEEERKEREYWNKKISLEGTGLGTRHDETAWKNDPEAHQSAA